MSPWHLNRARLVNDSSACAELLRRTAIEDWTGYQSEEHLILSERMARIADSLIWLLLTLLRVEGAFDDFNPKTTNAFLTYTMTVSGSSLRTADQISVVRDSVGGNASTACASNGGVPSATVGGPAYFYQTSDDGTSGTATITITQSGSHRVCVLAAESSTWAGIGQFNIVTASAPTIMEVTTLNPGTRTSSGTGNGFKALRYHPFELSLTGTGLVVGSSVEFAWFRGSGCAGNTTAVTGGSFRALISANNEGCLPPFVLRIRHAICGAHKCFAATRHRRRRCVHSD